jgi:uncharacterized protein
MSHQAEAIAAIQAGDIEALRRLLAEDQSLAAARDASGVSAIMQALYRRRQDMVEELLAAGAKLDFFEAASLGRGERVRELLENDRWLVIGWSADGFTALHFACFFSEEEMAKLLLASGAEVNAVARNAMKVRPLHSAAASRNVTLVRILLEHGASPNVSQQGGWTPLHSAAQHGDEAMIEQLMKHGAQLSAKSDDGSTAADIARKNGFAKIAERLG